MNPDEVVVWADGGARGNPGPAGFGVVVTTPDGEVLAQLHGDDPAGVGA